MNGKCWLQELRLSEYNDVASFTTLLLMRLSCLQGRAAVTAQEREEEKAPTSEGSWVEKALLVVCVAGYFFLFYILLTMSGGEI